MLKAGLKSKADTVTFFGRLSKNSAENVLVHMVTLNASRAQPVAYGSASTRLWLPDWLLSTQKDFGKCDTFVTARKMYCFELAFIRIPENLVKSWEQILHRFFVINDIKIKKIKSRRQFFASFSVVSHLAIFVYIYSCDLCCAKTRSLEAIFSKFISF